MTAGEPTPLLVRREGAVAVLTLNRPQRLNALTIDSYREISAALTAATLSAGTLGLAMMHRSP